MSSRLAHHSNADDRSDPADQDHLTAYHRRHGHRPKPPHHGAGARSGDTGGSGARNGSRGRVAASVFTLGHARRQVRLGPVAFWTVVGTLVIMAGWSVVTATYFAFQDDVLARMVVHQAEMQYAYEDRLAEMRAQVDRVTSRPLLDQEQLEQKLDQIVRRQSVLEQRATTLGSIADPAATGSVRAGSRH